MNTKVSLKDLQRLVEQKYGSKTYAWGKAYRVCQGRENPNRSKAPWLRLLNQPDEPDESIRIMQHEVWATQIQQKFETKDS